MKRIYSIYSIFSACRLAALALAVLAGLTACENDNITTMLAETETTKMKGRRQR